MLAQLDKELIGRHREEAWHGNFDKLEGIYAPDCVYHDCSSPFELPQGAEGIKQLITTFRTAFPDLQLTVEHIIIEEDEAAVRWNIAGTHTGKLLNVPPTGRKMAVNGMSQLQFSHGQIVEEWTDWDALGMLQQLGLVRLPFTSSI
jgi:steroid delta-isomerase-like uncharacterized protein